MSSNTKTRYRYIDYIKAFAMILVVVGHANFANESIKAWIYAFHMPVFFFASGLVMKNDTDTDLHKCLSKIWKRFQSLIFPYFVWAFLYAALKPMNVVRIIYGSHITLKSAGTLTSLWFLPTLFLAISFYETAKLVFKQRFGILVKVGVMSVSFFIAAVLPAIKHGYPWNLNVSFYAFGFLLLGNLLFPAINTFRNKIADMKTTNSIVICTAGVILSFAASFLYRFNIPKNSTVINTARAIYGFFPLFLIVATFGILLIMFISLLLDCIFPKGTNGILTFVGQNTLCIFAVHKPIAQKLFGKLFSVVKVATPVSLIITCIGTLAISCLITVFINRYLPLLAGKDQKRQNEVI